MGSSSGKMEFSGFYADDGTFVPFLNNKQVDFCVLLVKVKNVDDGCLSNYNVVRNILAYPAVFGKTAKDAFTNEKFQFCRIINDNNKRYLVSDGGTVSPDYVLVSYKEYYYRLFLENTLRYCSSDVTSKLFAEWDHYMLTEMYKTYEEQLEKNSKTRTK